jgi:hypothetical protein
LAYIFKDTFIAKGERAMKFLPSLWISIGLNYQYLQRLLVPLEWLSRLIILITGFKQLHRNGNRLTPSIIAPFLLIWLKNTSYLAILMSSFFLVTRRVSLSYNILFLISCRQNIYLIPRRLNTS